MNYTGPRLAQLESLIAMKGLVPDRVLLRAALIIEKAQKRSDAAAAVTASKKAAAEAKRAAEKTARRKAGAAKAAATKAAKKAAAAAPPQQFMYAFTNKYTTQRLKADKTLTDPVPGELSGTVRSTAAEAPELIMGMIDAEVERLLTESGVETVTLGQTVITSTPIVTSTTPKSAIKMKEAGTLYLDGEEKHDFDTGMGWCVFDAILYRYSARKVTMEKLVEILGEAALETGVSADDLVPVCDFLKCRMYALDETNDLIKTYEPKQINTHIPPLVFRVKNRHFYLITNENLSISQYASGYISNSVQVAKKDRIIIEAPVELVQLENTDETRMEQMVRMCNEQETEVYGRVCPPIVMEGEVIQSFTLKGVKYYWPHNSNIDAAKAIAKINGRPYCDESVMSIVIKIERALGYDKHKSNPNPYVANALKDTKNRTHYGRLTQAEFPSDAVAYDIGKCYMSILMNPDEDWMLIQPEDEMMPYSGEITWGVYAILTEDMTMLHGDGDYPSAILKRARAAGVKFTVHGQLIPSKRLPRNYFHPLINAMIAECGGDLTLAKPLINHYIGSLGRTRLSRTTARMDTDTNTAWTAINSAAKGKPFIHSAGNYYIYGRTWTKELSQHNLPIWIQIVEGANSRLFDMIEASGGELLGRKTDCAVLRGGSLEVSHEIGGYRLCGVPQMGVMKGARERSASSSRWDMDEWTELAITSSSQTDEAIAGMGEGLLIVGAAGTGKTHLAKAIAAAHSGVVLFCALSNMAARNIGGETIHKTLKLDKEGKMNLKSVQKRIGGAALLVVVDEVSMLDPFLLALLCEMKRAIPGSKFVLLGDTRQLSPIGYETDFFTSSMVRFLAGSTRAELTVRQRYDAALGAMADAVVAGVGFIKRRGVVMAGAHLCRLNDTRKRINAALNEKHGMFVPEGAAVTSQDVWIHVGLPVMAVAGRKGSFVNGERFVVTAVGAAITMTSDDGEEVTVTPDEFQAWFVMAYAMTVHKAQGQTITGPITIHDSEAMDARMLYTALTRGTSGDQMWFA